MYTKFHHHWKLLAVSILALALKPSPILAQGFVLPSVGAVNTSMGGSGTAAPLDAIGSLHWNPASISGLASSQMDFGIEMLLVRERVSSVVQPGAFGPGAPGQVLSGSNNSDQGAFPLPSFGYVYKPDESPFTYGLGVFAIGGFGANYPASKTNPILSPQPPNGFGAGAIYSQLQVLQVVPTVAYQLTERLSIGFAPTMTMAFLQASPAFFAAPDDANGDGIPSYPPGTHSRIHFGGGFQTGVYYTGENGWNFGASFMSPQWFEPFRYNATDELGRHRGAKLGLDYPLIVSLGTAYTGFDRWLFASDIRYVDFANTRGLRDSGFEPSGAGRGLGWDSTFLVGIGAQYRVSEPLTARMGYSYNPNPIPDAVSSINVASSPVYEHTVYLGTSYSMTQVSTLSMAYLHSFQNSITGPIVTPAGPVPGTSVTNESLSGDALVLQLSVKF